MSKTKYTIIIVVAVLIGTVLISGATFAYLQGQTKEEINVNTVNGKIEINYRVVDEISGKLAPAISKEDGLSGTMVASLTQKSIPAAINIYLTPTALDGLNISALRWEAYGTRSGSTTKICSNSGSFENSTVNTSIKVISGCDLNTSDTTFKIYIWLDSSLITDATGNLNGKKFDAIISADSVEVVGQM